MAVDSQFAVRPRPLESAHFGFPIFAAHADSAEQVGAACALVRRSPGSLLVLRVPCEAMHAAQAAESHGARLCDLLLTLTRAPTKFESEALAHGDVTTIELARPDDRDELVQLAGATFSDFMGHWHTDHRIDRALAGNLYSRWVSDLVRDASQTHPVLIARDMERGAIAGFLALRRTSHAHFDVPLTGVHPNSKGRGVFSALLRYAIRLAESSGATRFDYETQIQNLAAVRGVSRLGFVPESARITFHVWSDEQ